MEQHNWSKEKHTFFMALCRMIRQADLQSVAGAVWRSQKYTTGQPVGNGFILGLGPNMDGKTMCFTIDMTLWDDCFFAKEIPAAVEGTCTTTETTLEFLNSLFP